VKGIPQDEEIVKEAPQEAKENIGDVMRESRLAEVQAQLEEQEIQETED
jgi:hypothetical protein